MTEPCTIEQLEKSRETLRAFAVEAGRKLQTRKIEGAKMRELRGLETEANVAWGRFYSVDHRLRTARAAS